MKTRFAASVGAACVALLCAAPACFAPFSYGPRDGDADVPEVVSYEGDVYPILVSYCSSCHSESGAGNNTSLVLSNDATADYEMIASFVTPGDPQDSVLLQKAAGSTTHDGGESLSDASSEYLILEAWIEQGAAEE